MNVREHAAVSAVTGLLAEAGFFEVPDLRVVVHHGGHDREADTPPEATTEPDGRVPRRTATGVERDAAVAVPLRGEETTLGQAGYCIRCRRLMGDGPDACIGLLPGVSHACCGHGVTRRAYVVLGGEPGQSVHSIVGGAEVLRGKLALAYFGIGEETVEERPPHAMNGHLTPSESVDGRW